MVSATPGLMAQMTGFLTRKRYKYATVFIDQFSRLSYVHLQKTATAEETIEGKEAFERFALSHGVVIQAYHADNGIFKSNKWVHRCQQDEQTLTFAAVNAHHMNGFAERRIKEIQDLARSMLLHATRRWPGTVDATLWPYAARAANDVLNETPWPTDPDNKSPLQLFATTEVDVQSKHYHTFGCPVYVLESELQTGKPFGKWKSRAKVGVYLGRSPRHNRNVALVLSRHTGHVSPQFHVAYDDTFRTVRDEPLEPSTWQLKTGFYDPTSSTSAPTPPTPSTRLAEGDSRKRKRNRKGQKVIMALDKPDIPMDSAEEARQPTREGNAQPNHQEGEATQPNGNAQPNHQEGEATQPHGNAQPHQEGVATQQGHNPHSEGDPTNIPHQEGVDTDQVERMRQLPESRSGRKRLKPLRYVQAEAATTTDQPSTDLDPNPSDAEMKTNEEIITMADTRGPVYAYQSTSDPDTMYLHQAMKAEDREQFLQAMDKEVEDQMENGNFKIIPMSDVPKGKLILPAVWQMKRKRDIRTREIKKWKARLNIDGSRMKEGEHYDLTYAPVASWNSIRTLMILAIKNGWHTVQLDYIQAFPQAPVERELYMRVPKGYNIKNGDDKEYALRVEKNVYGQKQSGRVWNQFLVRKLRKIGFKQSKVDECIFYRGRAIYLLYTDDSILASPTKAEADKVIHDLKAIGLKLTEEGDIKDFLGVNVDEKEDGSIHLTQPHLIDQILEDLKFRDDTEPKPTPAVASVMLGRHPESEDFDRSFHYASVIGKLNYLERATRPDIGYSTHQCARFSSCPKKEHGKAVRYIGRYLKGTRNEGLILRPNDSGELTMHVDADFVGNWDPKLTEDRDTARSRHGYVISYSGCPIVWKSSLQTEVCLSSTESEYTGLSYGLRDAIPIMRLLDEMKDKGFPIPSSKPKVHCRVFEDNSGALETAKIHKYRPRTKHLHVKLHHFRDYVERGAISIHKISTANQPADFLTKPLNAELFTRHRRTVMGW